MAWLVIALALFALVTGGTAIARAAGDRSIARTLAAVALVLASLAALAGFAGTAWGKHRIDEVLPLAESTERPRLRALGYEEAEQCSRVGAFSSLPAFVVGLVGLALATFGARND